MLICPELLMCAFYYFVQSSDGRGRLKRRVLKSRTFLDDEGCMGKLRFIDHLKLRNTVYTKYSNKHLEVCCYS